MSQLQLPDFLFDPERYELHANPQSFELNRRWVWNKTGPRDVAFTSAAMSRKNGESTNRSVRLPTMSSPRLIASSNCRWPSHERRSGKRSGSTGGSSSCPARRGA